MPKKRKTRTTTARRQPKAPEGEEGNELANDIKAEKLKTLLADYDTEIASFFDSLREDLRDFEKTIECAFRMSISKIPKYIRDMDIEDYLKAGGDMKTTAESEDQLTQQIEMSLGIDPSISTLTKSKKKTKKKTKTSSTTETDTAKRPGPRRKKTALNSNTSDNMPPPSTRTIRSTRHRGQFETPFQRGCPSAAGWETPLVTPKFDPRLPVTPTMTRRPKTGEITMSLAGSPISNNENTQRQTNGKINPKQNKARLMVDDMEVDLDNIQIPDYEQTTRDYLKFLKEKLMAIPLSPAQ